VKFWRLNETAILEQEIEFLKQQIQQEQGKTEREREIVRDLSRRLDEEGSERRKLTAIITYKPEEEEQKEPVKDS
jgi:hypothetical protein